MRVCTTGVGTPDSLRIVTAASPVPSWVRSSSRSYASDFGNVRTVARNAFASSGVNARSACCTRLPSWPSTSAGTSFGVWVTKKTPTPFERMRRTVWTVDSTNALLASSKRRCASSRKKTSRGLSRSPTSGSCSKSSATSHMSTVDQSFGLSCTAGSSRHEMTRARPAPCAGGPRRRAGARRRTRFRRPSRARRASAGGRRRSAARGRRCPSARRGRASESRNVSSARRSERSRSGRPFSSA